MKLSISELLHVKNFKRQKWVVKSKSCKNLNISLAVSENLNFKVINKTIEIGLYSKFCVIIFPICVYDCIFIYKFIFKTYSSQVFT